MSALFAALALAAQVVTLKPADLPDKPVYVRIGVGVESRLTMPDGLVRLHGYRATADLLGVKLGQARPQALVLLHPRAAGVGRLKYVGQKHTVWFVVEASILGTAQDVEFRVGEVEGKATREHAETNAAAQPVPTPQPSPAPASRPSATTKKTAAPAPGADGTPYPPPPRTAKARTARTRSSAPRLDGAPTPPPPRPQVDPATAEAALDEQRESTAAATPSTAPAESTPAEQTQPAPTAAVEARATSPTPPTPAAVTARRMRRVGRPGQSGIVFEELRHADDRHTLRIRIERAAGTEVAALSVAGFPVTGSVAQAGHDLLVTGSITGAAQPRRATLVLNNAERWRLARFRLLSGGTR